MIQTIRCRRERQLPRDRLLQHHPIYEVSFQHPPLAKSKLIPRVLLEGVTLMEISVNPANQPKWDLIMSDPVQIEGEQMPPKLAEAVKELWSDSGVKTAFNRRNELQLNDSAP